MIYEAKYVALGDSYTVGEGVQESERFPVQTSQLLKLHDIDVTTLKYIAATGWTSRDLAFAINAQTPAKDFDIVTVLIGVNDQYQERGTAVYQIQFADLIDQAVKLARNRRSRVFVLSIPDYSVTPFVDDKNKARVSKEIDEYNAVNKEIALQMDIAYIDITPSSRRAHNDQTLIADDGLHPSGKEYAAWAGMLAPLIKKVLNSNL